MTCPALYTHALQLRQGADKSSADQACARLQCARTAVKYVVRVQNFSAAS